MERKKYLNPILPLRNVYLKHILLGLKSKCLSKGQNKKMYAKSMPKKEKLCKRKKNYEKVSKIMQM